MGKRQHTFISEMGGVYLIVYGYDIYRADAGVMVHSQGREVTGVLKEGKRNEILVTPTTLEIRQY